MKKPPPTFRVKNPAPRPAAMQQKDNGGQWRGSPRERGIDSKLDRLSLRFRRQNPFCKFCEMKGEDRLGAVADHIKPWHVFPELKYEWKNLQTLCQHHHDVTKQTMENMAREAGDWDMLVVWSSDITAWPAKIRLA